MPSQEHPSTYFVQDRANEEELERLRDQDRMLTTTMGGLLPEQANPAPFSRVLDVGCGTGGWLIELAKTHPMMVRLVGVDVSQRMISFARAQDFFATWRLLTVWGKCPIQGKPQDELERV